MADLNCKNKGSPELWRMMSLQRLGQAVEELRKEAQLNEAPLSSAAGSIALVTGLVSNGYPFATGAAFYPKRDNARKHVAVQ